MNILLTGASGFLGTKVLDLLETSPHKIIILHRSANNKSRTRAKNFTVELGDITDKKSLLKLKKASPNIDAIIHLAARVPKNVEEDQEKPMFVANVQGTQNLLDVFGHDLQVFIHASTVEVFGLLDSTTPLDENTQPEPLSYYAKTKLQSERVVQDYSKQSGVPVSVLRFSVMYGPGDLIDRAIPNFIKAAIADTSITVYGGEELRDYVHIKDAAKAVIIALEKKANGIFLIGSGKATSIKDAAEIISAKAKSTKPVTIEPRRKKRSDLTMDISKAKKILGYNPDYFFPDEINEAIEWMRKKKS